MNSTFLRVLAVLMVAAALVTGYLGYRISQKPEEKVEVVMPSYPQVVARNDIAVAHVLTAEDLELTTTQQLDPQAFSDLQNLLGKAPVMAIGKGEPLKVAHFPVNSLLGQALAPHERAVAIKVNEVIGVGGFIQPGDHVDVLLYLRTDRETGDVSSAQVVLANVKVLAYGALIGETDSGKRDESASSVPAKLGSDNSQSGSKNARDSRSAILAVAEQDVAKLMLADSTGILRLALRDGVPEATSEASASVVADNHFIRLGDISRSSAQSLSSAGASTSTPAPAKVVAKKRPGTSAAKRERVIIHHGEKTEVVNVSK
ncbi:pilus assembly protein CpaB [Methylophilus rhizosphaerae]|uniref:Pilus assembly protein CpaB n=1 Tax=Methylophilus rhizosphaerae TaxID=492660 RepID=A0A1G9A5Y7_9PROT|nr:Flp pilus assembly protein CpaB [Methylophilus rhizosphaerae]SDK21850.1 pilus assembly protein CpaB [Methylophilus rhizosphaerae]